MGACFSLPLNAPDADRNRTVAPSSSRSRAMSSALIRIFVAAGTRERIHVTLHHRIELLASASRYGERVGAARWARSDRDRREMRPAIGCREAAVRVERAPAPLHLIAFRAERLDALVERHRASNLLPNGRGIAEPDDPLAVGIRPPHDLAEHPPLRLGRPDPSAGDLGRKNDPSLGRGFRAAAGRFIPRRGRQQEHVRAVDQHRGGHHDVLMDAQPRPSERVGRAVDVGQRPRGSCRQPSRAGRYPRARCVRRFRRPSIPGVSGTGKPQTFAHRAAVSPSTFGVQPTSAPPCTPEWPRMGTRPRFGRPSRPRARPTLTSALMVSAPCTCWVNPMDQTHTVFGRSISRRAKATIRSRDIPLRRSI